MKKEISIKNCIVTIIGKLRKLPNGDVVVARRGKNGSVHRYQMHFVKKCRSVNQVEHTVRFKKARAEADRQLKVRACRLKWEVSYRASEGVLHGKKYVTLRGYVLASCYQMVETSDDGDG